MYHNRKNQAHISEPSASIHEVQFDSESIEDIPYSEKELALLRLLAKHQEEEFMSSDK